LPHGYFDVLSLLERDSRMGHAMDEFSNLALKESFDVIYTRECNRIINMDRADVRESFAEETQRKLKELSDFMAKWHDLPAQRSPQWLSDRTFSVGASEIATLLGVLTGKKINPYQTLRTLVGTKAGLLVPDDKTAMNWGCVMEKVVTMLAEVIFDCHIFDMGSIPTVGMRNQRSSPDGVAVIPCLGNKIVSFEFKAPKNRIPRGIVPAYYRPQVLTCLCAVEPSSLGIFVDCVIRRCSVSDWSFESPQYDYTYHKEIDLGMPMALGIVYFYDATTVLEEKKCESKESVDVTDITADLANIKISEGVPADAVVQADAPELNEVIAEITDVITDLGTCDTVTFDDYMAQVCAHTMRVSYSKIFVSSDGQPDWNAEIAASKTDPSLIGILPIKIMRCAVCPVAKEPDYVLQFQPLVDQIVATVHKILDVPEAERQTIYEQECNSLGWTDVPYKH